MKEEAKEAPRAERTIQLEELKNEQNFNTGKGGNLVTVQYH